MHTSRYMQPVFQSTIDFDNLFVPAIYLLAVRNCFCLTQAVSLCGKIKRRRLLTLPDDRTKLTDGSE